MQSMKDRRNTARFCGVAFVAGILFFVVDCGREAQEAKSAKAEANPKAVEAEAEVKQAVAEAEAITKANKVKSKKPVKAKEKVAVA